MTAKISCPDNQSTHKGTRIMHTIHKSLALAAAALGLAAGTAQAQFTTTTQLGGTALGSIVTNAPGSYTVEVGGGDIWAGSDTFTFHHAPIYGDFDVKVRVESSEYVNVAWSKSGIMVRETTAQNSRMFFPRVTPTLGANDYKLGYRTDPAVGTSGEHEDGGGVGPAYPNAWLRVQRVGSVLNGFYGTDGANWTLMGSQDTTGWAGGAFGEKLLIGVGGCRHDGNIPTATVEFRDFSDTAPLANVGLTREPVSATVNEGSPVTFTARVNAFYNPAWFNPSPILTWFTNGVAVAGATGLDFTIASAPVGFNGMTVSFSADDDGFGGVTSSNAILTVNGDTLAPSVPGGRAEAGATRTSVTIKYSEAMNPATAGDAFNYVITNSAGAPLNVISATMSGGNSNVVLVVDPFSADTQYYIVINNVTDASISGNALPADTTVGFGLVYVPNFIRLARYNGQFVGQNQVTLPTLPASPNLVELGRTSVEYGPDVADDYTSHMKGWFRAPTTGNYTVRITSDDPGQAWVSTDADPANKTILASVPQWTGFREWQAGAAIFTTGRPMVAGEIYYFETYHSEGGGGDHISLAIIPDGTPAINGDASIIVQAANVVQVSQIGDNNASVSITTPPADTTAQENSTASFSVAATTSNAEGGIVRYQWQKNGVDISGATGTSYATPLLAPGDNGSTYRCIVRVVGAVAYSAHATLTVTADTTPPSVVSVTRVSANQMRVNFSEPINATDLADPFNYTAFGPGIGAISTVTASGTAAAIIEVSGASTLGLYGAIVANVRDISAAENVIGANNTDDFLVGVTAENLQHRYTFNAPAAGDASGQVILDSVGTAHGQIKGSGSSYTGDRMVLNGGGSGTAAYGDLPNGLFSVNSTNNGGTGKLTVEGWVKVTAIQSWGRVFDFGSSDIGGGVFGEVNGPGGAGEGRDYVFFSAMNGTDPNTRQIEFRNEDPAGGGGAGNAYGVANFNTEFHYVVTWDEFTGQFLSYEDGVQRGNFTFLRPMSALNDVNCWLGRSQWGGDNNIQAEYNEFRLYNRVLSQSDAAANAASGPDVLVHNNPGAVTNVAVALTVGTVYTNQTSLASVQVAFANLGAFPVSPAFVAFTSDNGVVASVDANGLVTGLTAGTANIQAAVGSVTGSVAIVVTIDTNPPVLLSYAGRGIRCFGFLQLHRLRWPDGFQRGCRRPQRGHRQHRCGPRRGELYADLCERGRPHHAS
jgi:hypothetical protein